MRQRKRSGALLVGLVEGCNDTYQDCELQAWRSISEGTFLDEERSPNLPRVRDADSSPRRRGERSEESGSGELHGGGGRTREN